jgi:hypothetical protein
MAVRNESVRLSLDDDFTTKMARVAAVTALANKELKNLDGTSIKAAKSIGPLGNEIDRVGTSAQRTTKSIGPLGNEVEKVGTKARGTDSDINKLTGRLALFRDAALILGPAGIPLGAAGVGGLIGVTAQLGALAGGLGVTLLAVQGLGDGLKALDAYQLDPTTENLAKLNQQMEALGPSGEHFVRFLDSLEPELKSLQQAARDGLLPGAEEGIDRLLQRLPELKSLIGGFADTLGDLSADAGKALGGPRFDAFFTYLRTTGIPILDDTSRTIGSLAEAAANVFVGFGGVSTDFSGGLLKFSQGLAEASRNLDSNAGFQEFLGYIETNGPVALQTVESLANAFLQIVEAAAPLGGPVLKAVGQFADAIARIADSDLGTPIFAGLAALALLNRTLLVTEKLTASTFGGPAVVKMKAYTSGLLQVTSAQERAQMTATELDAANAKTSGNFGKRAGQAGLLAVSLSGVADSAGLSNTAMLSMVGPWGTAAGLALDFMHGTDDLNASIEALDTAAASGDIDQFAAALKNANGQLETIKANTVLGTSFLGDFAGGLINAIAPASNIDKFKGLLSGDTKDAEADVKRQQEAYDRLVGSQDRVAAAARETIGPMQAFRRASLDNTEAAQAEADALQDATDAMRDKRSEALRAVNAELNYQAAIDDANQAIKDNGKAFDTTTEKGRANRSALYALADGWNQQSDAAKNAKGSLKEARDNFIDTATQMGATAEQAKRLADRLFEIPPKRNTQITVDGIDNAINKAEGLKAILDSLKNKDINVALHYQTLGNKPNAPLPGASGNSADGGSVPKSGRPYADRYHYMLADGEEVISNRHGQADRHRSLLKAINAGGLADGGTAGRGNQSFLTFGSPALNQLLGAATTAAQALKQLDKQLEKSQTSLEAERQKRDDVASQMADLASTVASGLRSDIFAQPDNPFTSAVGGVAGANATLQSDIARAGQFSDLTTQLQGMGLHGGALQSLLEQAAQSGDNSLLTQFVNSPQADLGKYQSLYDQREQGLAAAGQTASTAVFQQSLDAANKAYADQLAETRGLRHDVKAVQAAIDRMDKNNQTATHTAANQSAHVVADGVTKGVNGAGGKGKRNGVYAKGPR